MAHKDTQLKDKKQQDAVQDTEARVEDVLDEYPEAADDRAIEDLATEELNENDKLKQELDDTKAALEKEKKEYLFLMADFDNYRKRVLKEKQELSLIHI